MSDFSWIRFACHGHVDREQPLESYFQLEDGDLRVQDIMAAHLEHAEFAFLSACHSAAGSNEVPDENIHLTSALQLAGFRSVVGTMWEMCDTDAAYLARHFYSRVMKLGGQYSNAAEALHFAIRKLRERPESSSVERWSMFVHIGA